MGTGSWGGVVEGQGDGRRELLAGKHCDCKGLDRVRPRRKGLEGLVRISWRFEISGMMIRFDGPVDAKLKF